MVELFDGVMPRALDGVEGETYQLLRDAEEFAREGAHALEQQIAEASEDRTSAPPGANTSATRRLAALLMARSVIVKTSKADLERSASLFRECKEAAKEAGIVRTEVEDFAGEVFALYWHAKVEAGHEVWNNVVWQLNALLAKTDRHHDRLEPKTRSGIRATAYEFIGLSHMNQAELHGSPMWWGNAAHCFTLAVGELQEPTMGQLWYFYNLSAGCYGNSQFATPEEERSFELAIAHATKAMSSIDRSFIARRPSTQLTCLSFAGMFSVEGLRLQDDTLLRKAVDVTTRVLGVAHPENRAEALCVAADVGWRHASFAPQFSRRDHGAERDRLLTKALECARSAAKVEEATRDQKALAHAVESFIEGLLAAWAYQEGRGSLDLVRGALPAIRRSTVASVLNSDPWLKNTIRGFYDKWGKHCRENADSSPASEVDSSFGNVLPVEGDAQSAHGSANEGRGTEKITRGSAPTTAIEASADFAKASLAELIATCKAHGVPDAALARFEQLVAGGGGVAPESTRGLSSTATLEDLVATLNEGSATPPEGLTERLEELVRQAQQSPPEDRRAFRDGVNALLDGYSLRFELEDGKLARLIVKGSGTIRFSPPGRENRSFSSHFSIRHIRLQGKELRATPGLG